MNKAAPAIIAPIVGALIIAAMGTTRSFDYAAASEDRQRKYLEKIARSFERNFSAAVGDNAIVERISADAHRDAISVEARFAKKEIETATAGQVEDFRSFAYGRSCAWFAERALLDQGVTLKMRIKRPSGAALTAFTVDRESCEPYRDAS